MRLALLQGPAQTGTKAVMLERLAEAARGADLLVAPELFLTGYNIGEAALQAAAEPSDGESAAQAAAIARAQHTALLYGYPERGDDGRLYNSAQLIGPDGARLANYRKTHLFGDAERALFAPGQTPFVLARVGAMQVGVLICYDVEFPEMVRGLAARGAQLIAVPTAAMQPYTFVPRMMVPVRAFENQVFVAYANRCGTEDGMEYVGESCIAAPDGTVLARAGLGEALPTATLDDAGMAASRAANPYWRDRQVHHYMPPDAPP